jgi:pimeloyl-ACP methyl ester carboxylesterase
MFIMLIAAALVAAAPAAPVERQIAAPGPLAPLAGTLLDAGKRAPVVIIIPGSGPTDRDGNNPLGVTAAPYRLLAEGLAARGVTTIRIDKRGMFGSKAAIANANAVTIVDYASDAHAWAKAARAATGARCVWLLGHSEGSLVALAAAQNRKDICGVISVSGAGRRLGTIIREQLVANPANAPYIAPAYAALARLEARQRFPNADIPPALQPLFGEAIQSYMIDLLSYDPPRLAASLKVPLLVIQGDRDLQVTPVDARALVGAQPKAQLVILPGVNHVLKVVTTTDRAANIATYTNTSLPISAGVVDAVAIFVGKRR